MWFYNIKWSWSDFQQAAFDKAKKHIAAIQNTSTLWPFKTIIVNLQHIGVETVSVLILTDLNKLYMWCMCHVSRLVVIFDVKHFHHFFYGHHFTIHSDHQSLRWLFSESKLYLQWLLDEYNNGL